MRVGESSVWALGLCAAAAAAVSTSSHSNKTGFYPGDLLLAGLFPMHGRGSSDGCDTSRVEWDGLFALEAFYLSLDRLNARLRPDFGFTLGAVTEDTCYNERVGLIKSLQFVLKHLVQEETEPVKGGHDVIGVVGPMSSDVAVQVANLLGMFHIPQISFAATSPALSNQERFPYFLRTVPTDLEQAVALVSILNKYNWTYVAAIYEDGNYGMRGFQELEKKARLKNICFAEKIPIKVERAEAQQIGFYRRRLRKLYDTQVKARVVVLYVTLHFALKIFQAAKEEGLGDHFVWVGTDGWGSRYIPVELGPVVSGAIVSHPVYREMPEFREHFFHLDPRNNSRNPWFRQAWQDLKGCELDQGAANACTEAQLGSIESQVEGTEFGYMHFVRDAVFAFGESLAEMHVHFCGRTRGVCPRLREILADEHLEPKHNLISTLRNISFDSRDKGRTFEFYKGRDGKPEYSFMTYMKSNKSCCTPYNWENIGYISTGELPKFPKDESEMFGQYGGRAPSSLCGLPCDVGMIRRYKVSHPFDLERVNVMLFESDKCCWSCERCPFPTYRSNESHCESCQVQPGNGQVQEPREDANSCRNVPVTRIGFEDTAVVAVLSGAGLGLVLTLTAALVFYAYAGTPIIKAAGRELSAVLLLGIALCYLTPFLVVVRPNAVICSLVRFFYSLSYTVSYAAIFVKINRIARIFHVSKAGAPSKRTRYTSPVSQLVLVGSIVTFQAALNGVWLIVKPAEADLTVDLDHEAHKVVVYEFCEAFEDYDMLIALLVPVILIGLSALYGFKARKCPGKFNETRYIILTTYTTCVVWIAFVPVFFTTDRIPLRIFSLCASLSLNATVTLLCLIFPRLYVAVCRPHKNTKEAVMGRKGTLSQKATSFLDSSPEGSLPDHPASSSPKATRRAPRSKRGKLSYAGCPLNSPALKLPRAPEAVKEESSLGPEELAQSQPHELQSEEESAPLADGEEELSPSRRP